MGGASVQWSVITGSVRIQTRVRSWTRINITTYSVLTGTGYQLLPSRFLFFPLFFFCSTFQFPLSYSFGPFAFASLGLVNLGRLKRHVFGHTLWNYPVYCGGFTGVPRGLCAVVHTCNVIVWLSVPSHIKEEKRKKEMSSECGEMGPSWKKVWLIIPNLGPSTADVNFDVLIWWLFFFFFCLLKYFYWIP